MASAVCAVLALPGLAGDAPHLPPPEARPEPRIIVPAPSAYLATPKASLTTWVAKVNGAPISLAFFSRRLAAGRAAAYLHFPSVARGASGPEFWSMKVDGRTPADWLKQRTLAECLRTQVELGLAKRHRLLPATSYAWFLQTLDRENERRRAALAKGEPIYGPQQYDEDGFFIYFTNNLRIALQEKLAAAELKPSDQALRECYESIKAQHFDRGYRVKIWAIEIIPGREGHGKVYTSQEARARLAEAKQKLDAGAPFEQVAAEYNEDGDLHEQVFDYESRSMDKSQASLRDQAMALSEGQTSDVFENMGGRYIIKCLEKDPLGSRPFEEVKDQVAQILLRQRYQALLDGLATSAKVKVNQAELDRIQIQ